MIMAAWKKIIFVNAIKARMDMGEGTPEELIGDYPKLSE